MPSNIGLVSRSVLNGVVGDHLAQRNNSLAIEMGLYHQLRRLSFEQSLESQLDDLQLTNKVVILVHGLTNLETVWDFPGSGENQACKTTVNYGTKLKDDFGFTPLFVRYNTGLPIELNGEKLSTLLEALVTHYPVKIDELMLLGFSMGGLLLRCAQKEAKEADKSWLTQLSKCVYIGTPHEGSPLEKFGSLAGEIVRNIPLDYVNHWAEWIDIRSQGIKDLRVGMNQNADSGEEKHYGSFKSGAEHYFISGSVGSRVDNFASKAFGDALVRQGSAVPSSKPANSRFARFSNLPHIPLAHSEKVYAQLVSWLKESPSLVMPIYYEPKALCNNAELVSPRNELTTEDLIDGVLSLASDTAQKVINTSETMQRSISDVPFGVLRKIPVINQVSERVESVYHLLSDAIYKTLKKAGNSKRSHTEQG